MQLARNCRQLVFLALVVLLASAHPHPEGARAADWSRFRGPNGSGISPDTAPLPVKWGEKENLKWKAELPGPGSSSPIVVGNSVFVTCWSGYGTDARNPGDQSNLKRHLVCIDRRDGKVKWSKEIAAVLPEERYGGNFAQHGYATHTPASDGERVYVFFGKTGVLAFDLEGKQLWQTSVGTDLDRRRWGSASSPILYKDLVIVPAVVESHALVALDKMTGELKWRKEAGGFGSTWGTPALVDLPDGRQELVIAVPEEIWGFDPDTGKFLWYCQALQSDSLCTSVVTAEGVVYAIGGRTGAVAVRPGGKGDVTKTHVLWSGRAQSRISTPLYHEGRLYWISSGVANCWDAKTGESISRKRLDGSSVASSSAAASEERDERRSGERPGSRFGSRPGSRGGGRFGGGRFGGGFGGRGGQDYSSPVAADGKLYFVKRSGEIFVLKLDEKLEQLGTNRFESDEDDFSATPAISDGELFIRSSGTLYCVAAETEKSAGSPQEK